MTDSELSEYELTGTRLSPQRMEVDTGEATFEIKYFLGSVLGCLNSTGTMVARDMGIDIDSLEMTVEGGVPYGTYRGEASDDRAGLQDVKMTMSVVADEAELEEWLKAVKRRCPVTDNVENETSLSVTLDVE